LFELSVFLRDRLIGRSVFADEEVRIGRSADNEVQIDNLGLSRYHASIELVDGIYILKDWSSQGTYVNGDRVQGRRALEDGDRIGLGKFVLMFRADKQVVTKESLKGAQKEALDRIRDKASYAVAGATLVGQVAPEVFKRRCPLVGHLESTVATGQAPAVTALDRDVTVVGSDPECELVVSEARCPERAAVIVRGWNGFSIVPIASQGVRHKDAVLDAVASLASGDELAFGERRYVFHVARLEVGP
jgi:pSer/pThr/pTyr-binding forkhead associated (FHA) protein